MQHKFDNTQDSLTCVNDFIFAVNEFDFCNIFMIPIFFGKWSPADGLSISKSSVNFHEIQVKRSARPCRAFMSYVICMLGVVVLLKHPPFPQIQFFGLMRLNSL